MRNRTTSEVSAHLGKKGRRHVKIFMCFVLCLSFLLTGCGGSGSADKGGTGKENTTADTAEVSKAEEKKSYFEERSDIETPDSIDTSVELDHIDDGVYYYTLGKDEEEAKAFVAVYMAYLETIGYTVENVSEKISGSGVAGFSIRKGGQPDGNMVFASMKDVGYVLGVSWY